MSLLDLRHRIQRDWFDRTELRPEKQKPSASTARLQRAELVSRLHTEVHRLQLEIADLSRREQGNAGSGESNKTEAPMSALQNELVKTQQELAKLQGRI